MPEWISYDLDPAGAVTFDAEVLDDKEFRAAYPVALIITVTGFETDEDGDPTDLAAQSLFGYEQAIEAALEEHDCDIVASASESKTYTIIAYAETTDAESTARAVPCAFKVDVRSERDENWTHYEKYALRGDELEQARDDEQISQLEDEGFEQGEEINIFFDVFFPDREDIPEDIEPLMAVTVKLEPEAIKVAREKLVSAIARYNGVYEGWGIDDDEEPEDEEEN